MFLRMKNLYKQIVVLVLFIISVNWAVPISLTAEEEKYLNNHPVINVQSEMDYPPFDFVEAGNPTGYSIDLLNLIADKLGLSIQYINGYSWAELVSLYNEGSIDLLHSLSQSPEREKEGNQFSESYRRFKHYFITRLESPPITNISELDGKTVAIGKGWATVDFIKKHYPGITVMLVKNSNEMLDAVSSGKAYATIEAKTVASYIIKKKGIVDVKIGRWFKHYDMHKTRNMHFMSKKQDIHLVKILNKALRNIEPGEHDSLELKWFGINNTNNSLRFTEEETLFIKNHKVIRASNEISFPPLNFIQKGQAIGFSIDYLNLVASKVGITIKYVPGHNWNELLDMAKSKQLDVMHTIVKAPSRLEYLNFTGTYGTTASAGLLYTKKNVTAIQNIDGLKGKTLAVVKDYFYEEIIRKKYPSISILEVGDVLEGMEAVSIRNADAFIARKIVGDWVLNQHLMSDVVGSALSGDPDMDNRPWHFGVRNDWPILVSILNKGMNAVSQEEYNGLLSKWVAASQQSTELTHGGIELTVEERNYLNKKGPLHIGSSQGWPPIDWVDDNGMHRGIAADFMNLISQRIQHPFEPLASKTWEETLSNFNSGKCDFISTITKTKDRSKYMLFSDVYQSADVVIATRQDQIYIQDLHSLDDEKIGVIGNSIFESIVREQYPNIEIVQVSDLLSGLHKVQDGEILGFVDNLLSLAYIIQKEGMVDIKISGHVHDPIQLRIAVHKDNHLLQSIFNKALHSISAQQRNEIINKWFSVKFEYSTDYSLFWKALIAAIVLFAGFMYWNRKLTYFNRKIKESEYLFRSLLESSEAVPFNFDLKSSRFTYMGPKIEELTGYPVEEWTDFESWTLKIHPLDRSATADLCIVETDKGLDHILEYRLNTMDGTEKWIREYVTVINENKSKSKLHGFMFDVTKEKLHSQELEAALSAAQLATRAKSEFLANMSHELRTPLNAILGFSQLMNREDYLNITDREHLSVIRRNGEHLLELINGVLEMSKIESGIRDVIKRSFDLHAFINNLKSMMHVRSKNNKVALNFIIGDSVPQYINADENKLRQILINLLGNAIKFTLEGVVALKVTVNSDLTEKLMLSQVVLDFSVEDTGPGIATEDIPSLFTAFTQTELGINSKEGTGLGLSICHQLVNLLGGEISVNSTVGVGSRFSFDLQVNVVESINVKEPVPSINTIRVSPDSVAPDGSEYRILVADDNVENRVLLTSMLGRAGFAIRQAHDGQEAVIMNEKWMPHLIWMDISMPVLDGYAAVKMIRLHEQENKVQHSPVIIALSASVFEEDKVRALEVGCDDFMRKPFEGMELFEKISSHLKVEYIHRYNSELQPDTPNQKPNISLLEEINAMPEEVVLRLEKACQFCDMSELENLKMEIEEHPEWNVRTVVNHIKDYAYVTILDVIALKRNSD